MHFELQISFFDTNENQRIFKIIAFGILLVLFCSADSTISYNNILYMLYMREREIFRQENENKRTHCYIYYTCKNLFFYFKFKITVI